MQLERDTILLPGVTMPSATLNAHLPSDSAGLRTPGLKESEASTLPFSHSQVSLVPALRLVLWLREVATHLGNATWHTLASLSLVLRHWSASSWWWALWLKLTLTHGTACWGQPGGLGPDLTTASLLGFPSNSPSTRSETLGQGCEPLNSPDKVQEQAQL